MGAPRKQAACKQLRLSSTALTNTVPLAIVRGGHARTGRGRGPHISALDRKTEKPVTLR